MTIAVPSAARYPLTVWGIAVGTLVVALAQAAYARAIGADGLFEDARSFGYDILLNAVAAFVFGRGERAERISALMVAGLMMASGVQSLCDGWRDLFVPDKTSTAVVALSLATSCGVSGLAAAALSRFRGDANPLVAATWLNARNDAISNGLMGAIGFGSFMASTTWVDCGLDLIAAALSFQAAGSVFVSSVLRREAARGDTPALAAPTCAS
ncbi:cation transporter [Methylobacterium sp. JK268]